MKGKSISAPTKIVVIGAGSASFGENTLSALLQSERLRGSTLALVDKNPASLDIVKRLADRLNQAWHAQMTIQAYASHRDSLGGADFVISALEVGAREGLWQRDFEIPLKYGVRQPYAENGGPGGFAHAARNIGPVMEIVRDMEKVCPDAWFINFTNPMIRICDAVNRHSGIKAVGLCHQIFAGYRMVAVALAKEYGIVVPPELTGMHAAVDQAAAHESLKQQILPHVEIQAGGLNHFTWMLSIRDVKTGGDLYPLFRKRFFELDPEFEPLTRDIFSVFGLFPIPGDTHLCEYLPWLSDPRTQPWEKYEIKLYDWSLMAAVRDYQLDRLNDMAGGRVTIEGLRDTDSEGALEIVETISGAGVHPILAANLPNQGQISNLPRGATVETPAVVGTEGVNALNVGLLPEPIAELCRRETTVAQLCVDAAVEGNREKALQSLLLDPVITDITTAREILNDYLESYREYLPQFWR
jgi:alpha-galactosidase